MLFAHALGTALTHGVEIRGRAFEDLAHCLGEGGDITGRNEPTVASIAHQLGDARDVGAHDRTAHRERFHDDHRQPFGEARQHHAARSLELFAHLSFRNPTRNFDVLFKPVLANSLFDFRAHLSIAGEYQPRTAPFPSKRSESIEQDQLSLLGTQAPNAGERHTIFGDGLAVFEERFVD